MKLWKPSGTDPVVESRAMNQARWLIRDFGDDAEAVIENKLRQPDVSSADIYRYELIRSNLKWLRREELPRSTSTEITVWQPRLFSAERLLRLFGVRAIDRRRRRRRS